jgi:hypothetical protein
VAARTKTWYIFALSNSGIVGSNPTRSMDFCVRLFCVQVADLRQVDSPSKESYRLCIGWRKRKNGRGPRGCRTIKREKERKNEAGDYLIYFQMNNFDVKIIRRCFCSRILYNIFDIRKVFLHNWEVKVEGGISVILGKKIRTLEPGQSEPYRKIRNLKKIEIWL